ncbi:MAG: membrane protein insertase YidC [Elusimicrobia bacterium]|nr:membrane protein insertase YidC [Elusimicrobiota bacterium]
MNKNLIIAVSLSLLVYLGWYGFVEKRLNPNPPGRRPQASGPASTQTSAGTRDRAPEPAGGRTAPAAGEEAVEGRQTGDRDRARLAEESDKVSLGGAELLVHPAGAAIVSCRFKGPLGMVELIQDPTPGLFATWPDLSFQRQSSPQGIARWTAVRPDGLKVTKDFSWKGEASLPVLTVKVSNPTKEARPSRSWAMAVGPGLGTVDSEKEENPKVWRAIGLTPEGKGTRGRVEVFKDGAHKTDFRWIGVDNRYFLAAVTTPHVFERIDVSHPPLVWFMAGSLELKPGEERAWEIPFYLGPKAHGKLASFGVGLERAIDFGFFASIGRFIMRLLGFLYGLTGNWGWAIILLTIVVQTVLFPLSYKTLKSAAAMKKVQPQMQKLQQQYAKDPARLNAEMLELYKRTGANPLGGCLPLLVQMPVFIALYNTLRNAWELHGAVWIFWVRDLSAKDPYYILPVVMGGLMFVQNKFSPSAPTDPMQAKMMTWMPVIFTFMFLKFPSGLVLYWLTNSVITVVEQVALKGHFEKEV